MMTCLLCMYPALRRGPDLHLPLENFVPAFRPQFKSKPRIKSGIAVHGGARWACKELAIYQEKQQALFRSCRKVAVAADPSSYAGEKTMVSIVYDVEGKRGCFPPVQVMPSSTMMSPVDFPDMNERMQAIAYEGKLERTSSYREAQALSHSIALVTGMQLDSFAIPKCIRWEPTEVGFLRVVDASGRQCVASATDKQNRSLVVPPGVDLGDLVQLTVCLDSGSVGRAGMSFAKNKLNLNVFATWDKYHRLIRDTKLSAEKSCGGQLYRALLHITFIFSLNQRPFGSGEWYGKKKEILAHFLDTHTAESPAFVKFAHLIADDFGLGEGVSDECTFACLSALPSFVEKGAAPKMMRWFSINQMWEARKTEFWSLKLILQHASSSEDGPMAEVFDPAKLMSQNPQKELSALKAMHGGLVLAEKLITPWLRSRIRIYITATRRCWTWYTHQVTTVKTPKDGLAHNVSQCCGKWQREIADLGQTLMDVNGLTDCCLMPNQVSLAGGQIEQCGAASVLLEFVVALIGNRAFANMAHDAPPFCYADVFHPSPAAKDGVMLTMKADWELLVAFETRRHDNDVAQDVFSDVAELVPPAVRLMYIAFHEDRWQASSPSGRRILNCLLGGMPDSKSVEDTHQHLRDLQRKGRSLSSSRICRHRACVASGTLEERSIQHIKTSKRDFLANFTKKTPATIYNTFSSRKHTMLPDWLQLMDKRDWLSKTPEAGRSSLACWNAAKTWYEASPRPKLSRARASVALPCGQVVECSGVASMCVGSVRWGALLCDLVPTATKFDEEGLPLRLWQLGGHVRWAHLQKPSDWIVVPHAACTPGEVQSNYVGVNFGVYVRQVSQPVPLLKYVLSTKITFTYGVLKDICEAEGIGDISRSRGRNDLITELAGYVAPGDASFAAKALEMANSTNVDADFVDPLTAAAFDSLDKDEQKEFSDLQTRMQKAKKAGSIAKWEKQKKARKIRSKIGARSKGKARAKAKGQRLPSPTVPIAEESSAASSSRVAPPAPQPVGAPSGRSSAAASAAADPPASQGGGPSLRGPREPDTFQWGSGTCIFDFTRRLNPNGWQVKCVLHEPQASLNPRATSIAPKDLTCSRQMSEDALLKAIPDLPSASVNGVLLRQLKHWAVSGSSVEGRSDHMSSTLFRRYVPLSDLPSDESLNASAARLVKRPRLA